MGIYLPMALTLLIPLGALLGWLYDRWAARRECGVCPAHGRAARDRTHRRREHHGRRLRLDRRCDAKRTPPARDSLSPSPGRFPISIVAFTVVILGFYAWTKGQAAVPALAGDDAPTPEATFR